MGNTKKSLIALGTILVIAALFVGFNSQFSESSFLSKLHRHHHHEVLALTLPENFYDQPANKHTVFRNAFLSKRFSTRIVLDDDGKSLEVNEATIHDAWRNWKKNCNKNYATPEEEEKRFKLWEAYYLKIEEQNDKHSRFAEAQNCYMDLTKEEFEAKHGGLQPPSNDGEDGEADSDENLIDISYFHDQQVPDYVSWKSVINLPMRYQKCGDCWANAATTNMEALWQIIGNNYTEFSVQENIDCDYKPNTGCSGGWMTVAYGYAQKYGAVPASDDPYVGSFDASEACMNDPKYKADNKVFVTGYKQLSGGDCNALKAAVANQPVSVAIDANKVFMATTSDIVPANTPFNSINHAVVVVGYTPSYWIIQNSWGPANGYNGYYRLAMGNTLNVCSYPQFPTTNLPLVKKPKTTPFDFQTEFGSGNDAGRINLNRLIGTKFTISYQSLGTTMVNIYGEKLTKIDDSIAYIPDGRDKMDFNYFRMAVILVDKPTGKAFNLIFEEYQGFLKASNYQANNDLYLAQCVTNSAANGPLVSVCKGLDDTSFFMWDSTQKVYVQLKWQKPPK